jgi:hypothetical protein
VRAKPIQKIKNQAWHARESLRPRLKIARDPDLSETGRVVNVLLFRPTPTLPTARRIVELVLPEVWFVEAKKQSGKRPLRSKRSSETRVSLETVGLYSK